MKEYAMSEGQACKLVGMDRSTYRYEPRPDHNALLREQQLVLARQKPRYGYRRLQILLGSVAHRWVLVQNDFHT